jgi:hypothetical protein
MRQCWILCNAWFGVNLVCSPKGNLFSPLWEVLRQGVGVGKANREAQVIRWHDINFTR